MVRCERGFHRISVSPGSLLDHHLAFAYCVIWTKRTLPWYLMAHADSTRSAMDHFALSASLENIRASIPIKIVYASKASRSEQYIVVQELGRLRDLLASRLTDFSRRCAAGRVFDRTSSTSLRYAAMKPNACLHLLRTTSSSLTISRVQPVSLEY